MSAILTKFNYLQEVVNTLRCSQGFYSRLARQLEELTPEQKQEIEKQLPEFKEPLDVILFLEQ